MRRDYPDANHCISESSSELATASFDAALTDWRRIFGTGDFPSRQYPQALDVEQAPSQADDDRMRSIVGLEFVHYVLDVKVDGCLGDG
jgi:hypothetical protein